jgi:hypothetical protein
MSIQMQTRNPATALEARVGWVWSVVDRGNDHDQAHVEYAAGACPTSFFGTIGSKRRQPTNPRRAPDA